MVRSGFVVLIAVAVLVRAASAQPSEPSERPAEPTEPSPDPETPPDVATPAIQARTQGLPREPVVAKPRTSQCRLSWYVEPSILLGLGSYSPVASSVERPSNVGAVMNRISGGVELRFCDADHAPTTRVHLGTTVYLSDVGWIDHDDVKVGVGVELEVIRPVSTRLWFGGRLGLETAEASMGLFTLGGRVHLDQRFWLGVDLFHRQPAIGTTGPTTTTTGVMAGLGIEGKGGVITAAVEGGILVTGFSLLVLAFANGGGSH